MPERKFYRHLFSYELLADEQLCQLTLDQIDYEARGGRCSGQMGNVVVEEVDAATMGRLLIEQRSDPEFLLDPDGDGMGRCPCCGEVGEPQHDDGFGGSVYSCPHMEDCGNEDLWTVPRFDTEITRRIEFLGIEDNGTWQTFIEDVPVQIRWESLQSYADNKLLCFAMYKRFIKIIPWNETPED